MGRTGAFIVIDTMLERMQFEKTLDIYCLVTYLRAQRNYMVQTEDQYVFIHETLLEAIESGDSEVPADRLYLHIQRLTQMDPAYNCTAMELEFRVCACFLIILFYKDLILLFVMTFIMSDLMHSGYRWINRGYQALELCYRKFI